MFQGGKVVMRFWLEVVESGMSLPQKVPNVDSESIELPFEKK